MNVTRSRDNRSHTRHDHWIDGSWVAPDSGEYLPSFDPASGLPWTSIARGNATDANRAVMAAERAFPAWSAMPPRERGQLLLGLADAMQEHSVELAEIESRDNGKLIRETGPLVGYLPEYYRYFGELADKIFGSVVPLDKPEMFSYVVREALGVVAMVTPWNSPLFLLSTKLPAALAAGNTVVVKPSEHASASTLALVQILERSGLPPGVVNVVTGTGLEVGAALTSHTGISKIAFTGGAVAARAIVAGTTSNLAKLTLELGGKSPQLVFADADLDNAVNGIIAGVFAASGQSCVSGSRVYVQRAVFDEVVDRLAVASSQLKMGHPSDPQTDVGPLALEQQLANVEKLVGQAVEAGGTIVSGGHRVSPEGCQDGWFYSPTVITGLPEESIAQRAEIFGPVVSVNVFDDEQEAVILANNTDFGLASGIWTSDISRAHRLIPQIRAGIVWVNTYRVASPAIPFGGRGASGYGIEGGIDGLLEFTHSKSVVISTGVHGVGDPLRMR